MTIEYLKKATLPQEAIDSATSDTVERLLLDIQKNGRDAVEKYARELDGWHGPVVISDDEFAKASKALPRGSKTISRLPMPASRTLPSANGTRCMSLRWS